ncbi:MAG: 3-phosphoshikimate 1-carboxyvinyltransferase [candidate division KSB1 bacterium]|nr:3-phosphoshikimate 1-carboxyvinyltransferase [candidate division KSB1 bacterium]MDQ7064478.1 3-phosphoshikimate 1-carboxyvinyltransferase [candidate division KSB1 bacterium]
MSSIIQVKGQRAKIQRAAQLRGTLSMPGDKSISHRALMLAALAEGESTILGLAPGEDVHSTRTCLEALGVPMTADNGRLIVNGVGLRGLHPAASPLDAGNSGTTMRLLSGILAGQPFRSQIDGDGSLRRRPMRRIIKPLQRMGAGIEAHDGGFAPLTIFGGRLRGMQHELPVASAQVKSCLLLAGLFADGPTTVIEPVQSRNHTEIMLRHMGVPVEVDGRRITVLPSALQASDFEIPGDLSSAAFFIAAALLVPKARLKLLNLGVNPTRAYFLQKLKEMGAVLHWHNHRDLHGEAVADLEVESSELTGAEIRGSEIPLLIDEIPILAVLATQANGETVIRDAAELRVKESDRLRAVAINLSRMGARVEELKDGLRIQGPAALRGAVVDSHGDHRIVMAFAVAGLIAAGETIIENIAAADISFPGFFERLASVVG